MQNKQVEAVQAKAKDLAARWTKEDGAKLAAEAGAGANTVTGLNQEAAQARTDLASGRRGVQHQARRGDHSAQTNSIALVKVQVAMPDNATWPPMPWSGVRCWSSRSSRISPPACKRACARRTRVKTNIDKARLAMGLDADAVKS